MYKVNVKERIKGLEGARKNSYGMTACSYAMELASFRKLEQEGVEEIIEIDLYKDDFIETKKHIK